MANVTEQKIKDILDAAEAAVKLAREHYPLHLENGERFRKLLGEEAGVERVESAVQRYLPLVKKLLAGSGLVAGGGGILAVLQNVFPSLASLIGVAAGQ